jgi:hypothetical protein
MIRRRERSGRTQRQLSQTGSGDGKISLAISSTIADAGSHQRTQSGRLA